MLTCFSSATAGTAVEMVESGAVMALTSRSNKSSICGRFHNDQFSFNYCSDTAITEECSVQGWPASDSVRGLAPSYNKIL